MTGRTATFSETANFLLLYFREHVPLGVTPPADLEGAVRLLMGLDQATDIGRRNGQAESLEVAGRAMATIARASTLSGLSPERLRCLAREGRVRGEQDAPGHPWHVELASVQEYLRRK